MTDRPPSAQWRRCSSCKKPIAFGSIYWVCNVSTCNRRNASFVFCTVSCWDAHLGVVRHRESWAEERSAPSSADATTSSTERARAPKRSIPASRSGRREASSDADAPPIETLIVISKLKQYVKAKAGISTSDRVVGPLSDAVRRLCDEAIEKALAAERKTLLERDFKP